jgi:hypothetical protein
MIAVEVKYLNTYFVPYTKDIKPMADILPSSPV